MVFLTQRKYIKVLNTMVYTNESHKITVISCKFNIKRPYKNPHRC